MYVYNHNMWYSDARGNLNTYDNFGYNHNIIVKLSKVTYIEILQWKFGNENYVPSAYVRSYELNTYNT